VKNRTALGDDSAKPDFTKLSGKVSIHRSGALIEPISRSDLGRASARRSAWRTRASILHLPYCHYTSGEATDDDEPWGCRCAGRVLEIKGVDMLPTSAVPTCLLGTGS
jgi:hypothetical protein